jgi:hypothetical protein
MAEIETRKAGWLKSRPEKLIPKETQKAGFDFSETGGLKFRFQ